MGKHLTGFVVGFLGAVAGPALAEPGYFQYPASTGDALIFTAQGDLWRKADGEPLAVRLTSHDEWEGQAHVSPDGRLVAFAASLDARVSSTARFPTWQVYVMPVGGGRPRQLTWELAPVTVRGWAPDGRVLYTSRDFPGTSRVRELRLVDPQTLAIERIPLRYATTGTFSDDGETLFFTRHGVSVVYDNARLYRGGGMAQLWRFRPGHDAEAVRLVPDFPGPVHAPMYWEGRIYFLSDRSGWDNIWSMQPDGSDLRRHTDFSGWPLQGATLRDGIIHYQRGADIYRYDIRRGLETRVDIDLTTDDDGSRKRWSENPMAYLEDASLGAHASRVAITARGHVVVAGTDQQRRVELAFPGDARARAALLAPEGDWVYVILGQNDTSEIWRFRADGSGKGEQLTQDATTHRWRMKLSPDGTTLLHTDKARRLFALDLQSGENRLLYTVARGNDDPIDLAGFSPGGRYLAFSTASHYPRAAIAVVDLRSGAVHELTAGRYHSHSPAFSPDGDWLYFISERHFSPAPGSPWGDRRMGVDFGKRGQLFALALREDARFPFHPPTELDGGQKSPAGDRKDDAGAGEPAAMAVRKDPEIDWAATARRLYSVGAPADAYQDLAVTPERLFLLVATDPGSPGAIKTLELTHESPAPETWLEDVAHFAMTHDAGKLLVRTHGDAPSLLILPTDEQAPEEMAEYTVRTEGWHLALTPPDDWQQLFLDGWRMHRDFAFDPAMRGVDWPAVRDRLLPLAARVGHRLELADLFGQMAYPLGILHSQIHPGNDLPVDRETGTMATLGARYAPAENGVRITHVYAHEFERPQTAGPLSAPGKDVRVGDVITQVNRRDVRSPGELAEALYFQAGEQVLLTLQRGGSALHEVVTPLPGEEDARLRYQDWVLANAEKVRLAGKGDIGYLHLRAMGSEDIASFARDWFPQLDRPGMIIDVRDNNGGNVDSIIVDQLLRRVWSFWSEGGLAYGNMQQTYRGHLAVLANAGTYSDGDTFAAAVKTMALAPVIGERTAGAGIWLSGRNRLSDGGAARIAEFPVFDLAGRWMVEGRGVSPTMEVVAGPHALFEGQDDQIDAAVAWLTARIREAPVPALEAGPLPPVGEYGEDASPQTLQR